MGRKSTSQIGAAALIDWHARHISNPMDRLRYLRAATRQSPASAITQRWRFGASLALAAFAISSVASLRAWRSTPPPAARRAEPSRRLVPATNQAVFAESVQNVWLVEQKGEDEEYSNGLRVDNHWAVANRPRSYAIFDVNQLDRGPAAWRSEPAGIVFHTTESNQAPFEPLHNGILKSIAEGLLGYVRNKRAYNFVVDRFGRVHRVVRETDAANHSGHSVWADDQWLYLDLNDSFLGISFEARTHGGEGTAAITPAQASAGALLVEMLRARYRLPARNCVTHAQVSVNPANMRIGYHTDWASNFPFHEMGLPDNYAQPLPGLYLCGFDYDRFYLAATGDRAAAAVSVSESRLRDAAAARHVAVERYRELLRTEYRKKISALRKGAPEGDAS